MTHTPSPYQQAIYNFIKNENGNLIVKANAGTGKTYTIKTSLEHIPTNKSVLVVAFSRAIKEELEKEIVTTSQILTFHQLGLRAFYSAFGKVKVDTKKLFKITISLINENEKKYISPIMKIVSLLKNNLLEPTIGNIDDLAAYHNIELPINIGRFCQLVEKIYEKSIDSEKSIDFDDMVCYPSLFNLSCKKYDFVFVDECLPGNTRIILENGTERKISTIVNKKENIKILTFNPNSNEQEIKKVVGWSKIPISSKRMLEIK